MISHKIAYSTPSSVQENLNGKQIMKCKLVPQKNVPHFVFNWNTLSLLKYNVNTLINKALVKANQSINSMQEIMKKKTVSSKVSHMNTLVDS